MLNNPTILWLLALYGAVAVLTLIVLGFIKWLDYLGKGDATASWLIGSAIGSVLLAALWFLIPCYWFAQSLHRRKALAAPSTSAAQVGTQPGPWLQQPKPVVVRKTSHVKTLGLTAVLATSIAAIPGLVIRMSDFFDWEGAVHFGRSHPSNQPTTLQKTNQTLLSLAQEPETPEPTPRDLLAVEASRLPPDLRSRMAPAFSNMANMIRQTKVRNMDMASTDLQTRLTTALGQDLPQAQHFLSVWTNLLNQLKNSGQISNMRGPNSVETYSQATSALLEGR